MVFIHGYNVTFEDAARRTAQMAFDLKFDGAAVMYSWPARGDLLDYLRDGTAARQTEPNAVQFLLAVAREAGVQQLHLVAHSMGNRVLTETLKRIADEGPPGALTNVNQVVLTAPDIDANVFRRDIVPRIAGAAQRITIYTSADDNALKASRRLHGFPRLGEGGATAFPDYPNIDVVDATGIDTSLLGHSYYGECQPVLGDLRLVLGGIPANQRGLALRPDRGLWRMVEQTASRPAPPRR